MARYTPVGNPPTGAESRGKNKGRRFAYDRTCSARRKYIVQAQRAMSNSRVWARFAREDEKMKGRPVLPGWVLDKIADEKANGGWDTRKENVCKGCWTYKSKNGKCLCEGDE